MQLARPASLGAPQWAPACLRAGAWRLSSSQRGAGRHGPAAATGPRPRPRVALAAASGSESSGRRRQLQRASAGAAAAPGTCQWPGPARGINAHPSLSRPAAGGGGGCRVPVTVGALAATYCHQASLLPAGPGPYYSHTRARARAHTHAAAAWINGGSRCSDSEGTEASVEAPCFPFPAHRRWWRSGILGIIPAQGVQKPASLRKVGQVTLGGRGCTDSHQ
jgi:hypothetical protein